jgi:hypothetical protein
MTVRLSKGCASVARAGGCPFDINEGLIAVSLDDGVIRLRELCQSLYKELRLGPPRSAGQSSRSYVPVHIRDAMRVGQSATDLVQRDRLQTDRAQLIFLELDIGDDAFPHDWLFQMD